MKYDLTQLKSIIEGRYFGYRLVIRYSVLKKSVDPTDLAEEFGAKKSEVNELVEWMIEDGILDPESYEVLLSREDFLEMFGEYEDYFDFFDFDDPILVDDGEGDGEN